jgi:hypothetical protein
VSQLEALSDLYKRPLVTFFLPSPPTEPPLPRDFRVLPSQEARTLSKKVLVAIRTARRVQRLYAHLRGGPVAPAAHALNQYGAPFVSMVLEAHARNLLTTSDVASYLLLKVKHLSQLQRLLAGQRGQHYGIQWMTLPQMFVNEGWRFSPAP